MLSSTPRPRVRLYPQFSPQGVRIPRVDLQIFTTDRAYAGIAHHFSGSTFVAGFQFVSETLHHPQREDERVGTYHRRSLPTNGWLNLS